jgi:hypothetical protein
MLKDGLTTRELMRGGDEGNTREEKGLKTKNDSMKKPEFP